MSKKTYSEKLKDPLWQRKRLEILNRDNFTCQYCGNDKDQLHVHHLCYDSSYNPWDVDDSALITVCETCHKIEHLKLTELEDQIITFLRINNIIYPGLNKSINEIIKSVKKL